MNFRDFRPYEFARRLREYGIQHVHASLYRLPTGQVVPVFARINRDRLAELLRRLKP